MSVILRQFESPESLNSEVADCLAGYFRMTGPGGVMLSGGRTPVAAYDLVCRRGIEAGDGLTILYSDERNVPFDSPDSNYGSTMPLIRSLGVPATRVIRVRTEIGWRESADRYDHDIRGFLASERGIKLGLLGLGIDGHTASLFSPDDVAACKGRYAVAIAREQKPDRVSVTPDLMRRIERIIILAAGQEKRAIVEKLIRHPDQVVAGLALNGLPAVEIWQA